VADFFTDKKWRFDKYLDAVVDASESGVSQLQIESHLENLRQELGLLSEEVANLIQDFFRKPLRSRKTGIRKHFKNFLDFTINQPYNPPPLPGRGQSYPDQPDSPTPLIGFKEKLITDDEASDLDDNFFKEPD
jgi:hypothetical protein